MLDFTLIWDLKLCLLVDWTTETNSKDNRIAASTSSGDLITSTSETRTKFLSVSSKTTIVSLPGFLWMRDTMQMNLSSQTLL
jgi:hypothetical protein